MLVAGVDSSTQSTKVLLCEAADGTIVARGSAPHPGGTEHRMVCRRGAVAVIFTQSQPIRLSVKHLQDLSAKPDKTTRPRPSFLNPA